MVQETERGLVQGSEEAEMVLSDGLLPHPQNPSLYYPVLLLYFQMCRIINLLVMVIVHLPPLQCKVLKGRDFFDSFIDMLSTIKEYLAHSRMLRSSKTGPGVSRGPGFTSHPSIPHLVSVI